MVGGTGRSGTTVLGGMLGQHPQVFTSLPREVKFITESFGLVEVCVEPERALALLPARRERLMSRIPRWRRALLAREFTERMRTRWWERQNRKARSSGLHLCLTEDQREQLIAGFTRDFRGGRELLAGRNLFYEFIRAQRGNAGAAYWVDTSPPNIAQAPAIARLLPGAKFIWVVRDGKCTAASALAERWGPTTPEAAIEWWETRLRKSSAGAGAIAPDQLLVIALEDLVVREREGTYQRLLEFLGIEDNPQMRAFFEQRMPAGRVRDDAWRERVPDPAAFEELYARARDRLAAAGIDAFET